MVLKALDDEGVTNDTIVLFFSDNGGAAYAAERATPSRQHSRRFGDALAGKLAADSCAERVRL